MPGWYKPIRVRVIIGEGLKVATQRCQSTPAAGQKDTKSKAN